VTEFRLAGAAALKADLDAHCAAISNAVAAALPAQWPEPGSEPPHQIYGVWAREWREELTEVTETIRAISDTLSALIDVMNQLDAQAAAAFEGGG